MSEMNCFLSKLCTILATPVQYRVMILNDEHIVILALWHVTMSYPYYDSHVKYYSQQNIIPFPPATQYN